MNAKKITRIFFYLLGIATGLTILSMVVLVFIRSWAELWILALSIAAAALLVSLYKLANWAFDEEKPYPFQYKLMPPTYPVPNYFDSEEAGLLSDGRAATPLYNNNKFMGRVPLNPFFNERVGDYRWGKSHHGDWVWLYDPMIVED